MAATLYVITVAQDDRAVYQCGVEFSHADSSRKRAELVPEAAEAVTALARRIAQEMVGDLHREAAKAKGQPWPVK